MSLDTSNKTNLTNFTEGFLEESNKRECWKVWFLHWISKCRQLSMVLCLFLLLFLNNFLILAGILTWRKQNEQNKTGVDIVWLLNKKCSPGYCISMTTVEQQSNCSQCYMYLLAAFHHPAYDKNTGSEYSNTMEYVLNTQLLACQSLFTSHMFFLVSKGNACICIRRNW